MIEPLPHLLVTLHWLLPHIPSKVPFVRVTHDLHVAKPSGHFSALMTDTVSRSVLETSSLVFLSLFVCLHLSSLSV